VVEATKQLGLFSSSLVDDQDDLKTVIEDMKPEDFGKFKM